MAECDGDYTMDTRRSALLWQVELQIDLIFLSCSLNIVQMFFLQHTLIDANNKSGSLEFSVGGNPDDFFPVTLGFNSTKSFSGIKVKDILDGDHNDQVISQVLDCVEVDGGSPVKHSTNTTFFAEKYEVV